MVFSGLYPIDGSDYPDLREALDKLKLNDAALVYEPETSVALGFGFRCGFLGLLHLEIVRERLEREFDLELISTAAQRRLRGDDGRRHRRSPSPTRASSPAARSPRSASRWCAPPSSRRASSSARSWSSARASAAPCSAWTTSREERVEMRYTLPLAEIVFDFFDQLKSRTRGYASLDYEPDGEQAADLVKVDILLQGETGRRLQRDRAQGQGLRATASMMAGKLQGAHPAPAVRGADPGRRSAPGSSPARTSARSARTSSPSATAATSPASASCSRSRRRARSG